MKRYGNLWPDIIAFPNLLAAAKQAQRGKRFRDNVLLFNFNLETELLQLQQELQAHSYQPGAYRTFEIFEPKRRLISAAPYRDRVVHHALCNLIGPIFESTFIADSYANRFGFGTHRALKRFIQFTRSSSYILQCDIKQYFPTINHAILKQQIRRKIKCPDTLWLIDLIIDSGENVPSVLAHFPGDSLLSPLAYRCGLPIGNLTSQFFANIYLNGFDHFIKEELKIKKYIRYVDDFAFFSDDPAFLAGVRIAIEAYLATLRLKIHPIKSQLFRTRHGATFLGFRVLPNQIRVRTQNLQRGRRRLKILRRRYLNGEIPWETLDRSLQSWFAHLKHGTTRHLREQIVASPRLAPPHPTVE